MKSVNQVELIGFIGSKEPMINLSNGTQLAKFSLSTPEKWVDKTTKTVKEHTEWHSITIFGKQAETAFGLLSVGDYVRMIGKLKTDKWVSKEQEKKQKTYIVCNDFILLSSKEDKTKNNNNNDALFNPND